MQIHELNNYNGNLDSSAYLAVDNGSDTGKVSTAELLADTNAAVSQLDTVLNGRIDNIVAGGKAPSTSEIVDARYGADGVTYPSLGAAIRYQVTDLKSDLVNGNVGDGSIKVEKLEGVVKVGGYKNLVSGETLPKTITDNGEFNDSASYSLYVEKIPVKNGDKLYRKNTDGYSFWCCYDENDNPIPRTGGRSITIISDEYIVVNYDCSYIRISDQNKIVGNQIWSKTPIIEAQYSFDENLMYADLKKKIDEIPIPAPTETTKYPNLKDKKWLFMGDSITEGYGASDDSHKYVNKCIEYSGANGTNRGVAGSTISWRGAKIEASVEGIYTLSTKIDFSQYDLVTIFAGTNDWGYPQTLDDLASAYRDTTPERCVVSALEKVIKNILASNSSIKIAVFTPMFRSRKSTETDGINSDDYGVKPQAEYDSSAEGKLYYLYVMADMIEEVCKKYHIPCKNMYRTFQCGKENASIMLNDGLHPTDEGHDRIANVICSFVSANCGF